MNAHNALDGPQGSPFQHSQADEIAFARGQRRESLVGKPTSHDSEARVAMVRSLHLPLAQTCILQRPTM